MTEPTTSVYPFGVELVHSRVEVNEHSPDQTARERIAVLEQEGDYEQALRITEATEEIMKVVVIKRREDDGQSDMLDLFTAQQLIEMQAKIHAYLGSDLDSHIEEPRAPSGYPFYVERLESHFRLVDDDVTTNFGAFAARHADPMERASGPLEQNSRNYATTANEVIIRSLDEHFQSELDITLHGPTKKVEGARLSWERGIAECQFLVLDHVRDQLAMGHVSATPETITMSVEDLGINIKGLLTEKKRILSEVQEINPILAERIEYALERIAEFAVDTFHRGRMGIPRFKKEPRAARAAVYSVEALLLEAAYLSELETTGEEIPVLEP